MKAKMETRPGEPAKLYEPGGVRELWALAYPVIVASLSQSLMGLVDTFFMGRIGTLEQGAVGFSALIFWTVISLFVGTQQGVTTFAAQHFGALKFERCGRDAWLGLFLCLPSAAILMTAALFCDPLFRLIGTAPEIIPHASTYQSTRMFFSLFVLVNYAIISFLRGIGDTKTPMYFTIGANVLNALLDYALILGHWGFPRMGAKGAALGSGIATAGIAVGYFAFFLTGERNQKFKTRSFRPAGLREIIQFLKVGGPIGGSWALEMISWALFLGIVSRLGQVALTATTIVFEVLHFSFMVAVSLGTAATTLVGQYIGARDLDTAQRSAKSTLVSGMAYCVFMGMVFVAGRRLIMETFTLDPAVVETGEKVFLYAAAFQLFDGLGISCNGIIRGAGDTRWPMVLTVILAWGIFLPLVYSLTTYCDMGVDGAWLGATVFLAALGTGVWMRYRSGRWMTMRV